MARDLAAEWPDAARNAGATLLAGPADAGVAESASIPGLVTAGLPIGIRVPAHPVALELIRAAGVPIAAPSANRFTEISPTTAAHVRRSLGGRVESCWRGPTGWIESAVISLVGPPAVLRPGMISQSELEAATGIS